MNLHATTTHEGVAGPSVPRLDTLRLAPPFKKYRAPVRAAFSLSDSRLGYKLLATIFSALLIGAFFTSSLFLALYSQAPSSCGWVCALAALVALIALIALLSSTMRSVVQPVLELTQSAKKIRAGKLDYPCRVEGDDELADLARAVDGVRCQLKTELGDKERLNQELRILNEIALATYEMLDPQEILDFTLKMAISALGVEAGALYLQDPERGIFCLHACQGIADCKSLACNVRALNHSLAGLTAPDGQVVSLTGKAANSALDAGPWFEGRSFIGIPLKAKGLPIGAMTLVTRPGQVATEEGTATLKALGEEIGLALANVVHFKNVRYQATLVERERLAREMHDSLAQALGYLKMKASMTDDLLSGGEIAQAQTNLREVKELAGRTYFDVREAIFGLRHTASPGSGFLPTLEDYLNDYRTYYGLDVNIALNSGEPPSFSPMVSMQLSRIIMEALTNVRKHAQANQARICFEQVDHHWRVTVEDNGAGFDPSQVQKYDQPFFGLQIMRERAESVGASLKIDSHPNSGTRITILLPISQER